MTKNIAVVLPAEARSHAAEEARTKAKTIAAAAGSAVTAAGRMLCAGIAAYADAAAAARVTPFDVLTAASRKDKKRFD
jgi:hypothetical protein